MNSDGNTSGDRSEMLQEALRAFGNGRSLPQNSSELSALLQQQATGIPDDANYQRSPVLPSSAQANSWAVQQDEIFVFVRVGSIELAWPTKYLRWVESLKDITVVPNVAPWIIGVAYLQGVITSVVDMQLFLGLGTTQNSQSTRIVVTQVQNMVMSFLVDEVLQTRPLQPDEKFLSDRITSCPDLLQPFVLGAIASPQHTALIIDIERFLFQERLHHFLLN